MIVSRRTLAETADWMNTVGHPVSIQEIADHYRVGYNRAAEITRYGTRHGWFEKSWRSGATMYFPTGSRPQDPNTGASPQYPPASTTPYVPPSPSRRDPYTGLPTRPVIPIDTSPPSIPITFGIEVEMDFLVGNYRNDENGDPNPLNVSYEESGVLHSDPSAHVGGWASRVDGTVGAEVASPVWGNIGLAMFSTERQWGYWMATNEQSDHEAVPYLVGSNSTGHRSIGQHIHLGTRERALTRTEKTRIANYTLMDYPLIIALTANSPRRGYSSYRIGSINGTDSTGNGRFARPMCEFEHSISAPAHGCGHAEHYEEISDSAIHGTIEFRAQDSTIPQATLLAAWLLQKLAERAISQSSANAFGPGRYSANWMSYRERRDHACEEDGPTGEERRDYVDDLVAKIGDLTLDDQPDAFKEILYLGLNRGIWPGMLYEKMCESAEQKYHWFKGMLRKPREFISVILDNPKIADNQKAFMRQLGTEIRTVHKFSDLRTGISEMSQLDRLPDPDFSIRSTFVDIGDSDYMPRGTTRVAAEVEGNYFVVPTELQERDGTTPVNGWFRLRELTEDQALDVWEMVHGEAASTGSISTNGMSVAQMRRSPQTFMAKVVWRKPVDVWVFDTYSRYRNRNRPTISEQQQMTPIVAVNPDGDDVLRALRRHPTELHNLVANGSGVWPWYCNTCGELFANHVAHIEYCLRNRSLEASEHP